MWVLLLILKILLYIFTALLLILLTILIVPFTYKGEAAVNNGVTFSYELGWFWKLFAVKGTKSEEQRKTEVFLGNRRLFTVSKVDKTKSAPDEDNQEEKAAAKKENNLKSMFDINLIKEAFSYFKKLISQISPKQFHLYGSYGFDDPSITGMTAGFIYTLKGLWPHSRIMLQPSFTEEILELELMAAGKINAGRLIWDAAGFLLKKDVRTKIFKRNKKVKLKAK